jgi:hypothetical protein
MPFAMWIGETVGLVRPVPICDTGCAMPDSVNDESPSAPGRALVPVGGVDPAPDRSARARNPRPLAAFLAHLVATAQGVPQTRQRRRASADYAATLYAAAAKQDRPGTVVASM